MAKHTVYLSLKVEQLMAALLSIHQAEHPGITPRPSAIVADALWTYAGERLIRHFKDFGCSAKTKAKLEALAVALDQKSRHD